LNLILFTALSHTICNHDDQHWDSVVQYLQDKKMIPHWNYAPMFAHVEVKKNEEKLKRKKK